jgi:diaminopimelate decarboxylase
MLLQREKIKMAKKYEKPVILKVQTGMMNKFGSSPYYTRKIRTEIDSVAIDELVEKFGSPLFVFSETTLRQKYRAYYNSFSTRYPNVTFGWSYKTNYLPAVCSVLHQEGAIAEVVSEMEYDKARSLGIPGNKIIYNGPYKNMNALEKAVKENAMIHIDHFDEIYDLEKVADKLNKKIKVGMRLNMDTGIYPQWSRFGLNLDSGQAMDAVKRMASKGKLVLNGLHCHIGTYIQDKFDLKIEYYDIGGGFPSKSKLKGTYQEPDVMVPSIDEYAENITTSLFRNLKAGDLPKLYLETGRGIVDEAGYLITTIIASKKLPDGRKSYIADGGINLLYTAFWYKYNLEIDRQVDGTNEPAIVNGPLCMNIDVIEEGTLLPPMEKGTRLILSPVGAYNVTQWMQFIEYRPNVVMIGENKELDIIREAEDLSDITRREKLPDRLKLS